MQTDQPLQWAIQCAACHWQVSIQALVAIGEHAQIDAFREDYICPKHYQIASRTLRLQTERVGLEEAYLQLFGGMVTTVPVPRCPICRESMQGGQCLEALPFHLEPHIELQYWVIQKLNQLKHIVEAEEDGQQLIIAEVKTILQFYKALCKQFDIRPEILLENFPTQRMGWLSMLDESIETAQARLTLYQKRQSVESQKTPGYCPNCQQQSVYLRLSV